ncbi:hypothetical protein P7K49_035150 [Saguinus oedipus]|uniref:Uncharacterized protein n=1 Tax=Saguinus oedipus TaxID=9490 RepID=A0ABQ9TXV2_SAGOE|nr:hypothetical protein P7K49_035150 [Saguinus oedipus]
MGPGDALEPEDIRYLSPNPPLAPESPLQPRRGMVAASGWTPQTRPTPPAAGILRLGTWVTKSGSPLCQQPFRLIGVDAERPAQGLRIRRGVQEERTLRSNWLTPPKGSSAIPRQYQSCTCKLRIRHGQQWEPVGEGATPDFPCVSRSLTPARQSRGPESQRRSQASAAECPRQTRSPFEEWGGRRVGQASASSVMRDM